MREYVRTNKDFFLDYKKPFPLRITVNLHLLTIILYCGISSLSQIYIVDVACYRGYTINVTCFGC